MKKIESFTVNHLTLERGLYVSRIDGDGKTAVTTFDLRFTLPNREPVMETAAIHTIEHLGATYLRNSAISDEVVYFGPMGCRTGFYMILFGKRTAAEVCDAVLDMCDFILSYEGDIPGATPRECGNYSEQDLATAKIYVKRYSDDLRKNKTFDYPSDDGVTIASDAELAAASKKLIEQNIESYKELAK